MTLSGLSKYQLLTDQEAVFHRDFQLALPDVRLKELATEWIASKLNHLKNLFGVYFWIMVLNDRLYKIYVGKTKSLPQRLTEYRNKFQLHSPNDYKMQFFQDFIIKREPRARFDLYFCPASRETYTEKETEYVRDYGPLINEKSPGSSLAKRNVKQAFWEYYDGIFESKLCSPQ